MFSLLIGFCLLLLLATSVSYGDVIVNQGFDIVNTASSKSNYATVYNPDPTDRLNLRVKANANSDTIGKYYSGYVVTILEYTNMDWVKVSAGDGRVGYMMRKFLVFDPSRYVKPAMPMYTMKYKTWKLYASPNSNAKTVKQFTGGETIQVVGIVYDWWHIRCGGYSGFISQLVPLWHK